ncbi:MAG TPA: class I adenylate-forming enzyme family protein [Candidatus Dormibacteraeota bacterium]|nr:class I adenylate-forming enzyme family protein [Candidatus Dormibacteraeota bacterium]
MTALDVLNELERQSIERPDALALRETSGRRLTFSELHRRIGRVASGLLAEGMRPGDRVLFTVPPGIDSIVLILAIVRAGGVVIAANPLMGPEVFASRIRLMEPSWVMATSLVYLLGRHRGPLLLRRLPVLPDLGAVPARRFVRVGPPMWGRPHMIGIRSLVRAGRSIDPVVPREAHDPVVIVFTSGTTAAPRAVVHTNASIGAALEIMSREARFASGDVLYSDQLHLILPALLAGVPTVIPRGRFRAPRLLDHLRRYRVTHTFGVPSEYQELVEYAVSHRLRLPDSLRKVLLGSAAVPTTFLRRLVPVLPLSTKVTCVYGMTEVIPVCLVDLDAKLAFHADGDLVGAPVAGVHVRTAADGELIVRGPNVCAGYWGDEPITEVRTGDFGSLDASSRVILLGRKKAMIIRGQENIYPELFESTIAGIAGVRRCCLVGLYQDQRADEEVVLCIEPDPGVDESALTARVRLELRQGPHRIDAAALPDRIIVMPIPLSVRSRKVDRTAVLAALGRLPFFVGSTPPC